MGIVVFLIMARPLRVEYPEALYHVTARGNDRRPIFAGDKSFEHFLSLLAEGMEEYEVLLHSYVLMTNHYHLVVRTLNPNLNKFMHFLNTAFTVWANKKYRRTGHLFEGRYKAIVMEEEGYLLRVTGYVHLNPVRIKGWMNRPWKERLARLKAYPWSSYSNYTVARMKPRIPLVSCQNVYGELGARTRAEGRRCFRKYITGWLQKEEEAGYGRHVRKGRLEDDGYGNPFSEIRLQSLLGGDEFRDRILGLRDGEEELSNDIVGHDAWLEKPSPEVVLNRAMAELGVSNEVRARNSRGDEPRSILMYLCKDISKCGLREVGDLFRLVPSAVSIRLKNLRQSAEKDKRLKTRIKTARESLIETFKT